jgi:hypothetical protein
MATLETNTYDNLIAGDFPLVTKRVVLLSGQNLSRGALLGKITSTGASQGKVKQCDSGNSDGSENPWGILVDDMDASSADKYVDIYLSGEFNGAEIGVATGDDIDEFADDLRELSIFIKTTQGD